MDAENYKDKKKNCCKALLPARYLLSLLAFVGLVNNYAVRTNLSIAIVSMVTVPKEGDNETKMNTCPELKELYNVSGKPKQKSVGEFDWDPSIQGYLLSAFFYGLLLSGIPGGVCSSWYGGKWIFGVGNLVSGTLTLLTPVAARWSPYALVACRMGIGLGTGVAFPSIHTMIGKWMPENERSTQNTIIYNGIPIGTICTLAFSGLLIDSGFLGGWPSVFYITGFTTCVWFVLWAFLVYESPFDHPLITKEELALIVGGSKPKKEPTTGTEPLVTTPRRAPEKGPIPWKGILTSSPVYALAVVHFGNNWGFYTLLTFLPTYLRKVLHFNIKQNGFLSATPYICLFLFASVSSLIVDKFRRLGKLQITTLRKISNSIAMYVPGLCLVVVPFVGCHPIPVVTLLSLCAGFNGFKFSGFHVTPIDMSPDFGGVIMSATNTMGTVAGIIAPVFAGKITDAGNTLANWKIVFLTTAMFYFLAGTVYNVFCTAEEQPWGRSPLKGEQESQEQQSEDSQQKEGESEKK